MNTNSETTEAPPVYLWDQSSLYAFITVCLLACVFLVNCLLYLGNFSNVLLYALSINFTVWTAQTLWHKSHEWNELRKFKKTIPEGMENKNGK